MDTLQELVDHVLRHEQTIVFGNLGRYPKILYEALAAKPLLEMTVVCDRFPSTDPRIRVVQNYRDPISRCDVLVYVEPPSLQWIEKIPSASHTVVFTSHFTFRFNTSCWTYVCYFHTLNVDDLIDRTQKLLDKQDSSLQTRDPNMIGGNYTNVFVSQGQQVRGTLANDSTYFVIDLTQYKKDTLSMYLAFWDAFDFMLEHLDAIERWVICFADTNGRRAFDMFTQKCIDFLFCRPFQEGNVTELQKLLQLIPFYKSGIIDSNFQIPVHSFGGLKLVIPKTVEEANKAAAQFDLDHLDRNVYCIRE